MRKRFQTTAYARRWRERLATQKAPIGVWFIVLDNDVDAGAPHHWNAFHPSAGLHSITPAPTVRPSFSFFGLV
jgi:hypothetical protein